ncbi:MAG: C45 family peptidase [Actinomycetota bacterium]|nr:C45 family peptidase [Actinomycetota bacterium]
MTYRVKVVRAEGDAFNRGRTIGREFADPINRSVAFYYRYFERRGFGRQELEGLARPFVQAAESILPSEMDAIRGMAEGADVELIDLIVPNAFEELDPLTEQEPARLPLERCTTFAVTHPGVTLLGHNEQWIAGDAGLVGVIIEIPEEPGATTIASPTVPSWRPAVGMNSAGWAQGVMSLTASDDGVGVPRVLVSRHALESVDRDDAIERTAIWGRSGGYAYVCARKGGEAFTIETTATRHALLPDVRAHTNHYLDPDLAQIGEQPSEGSLARCERLTHLLAERPPETPQDVIAILADHGSNPSICRHADPDEGEEADAVLFGMVCDLEAKRMWVAPGYPCEGFEQIDLAGAI